MRGDAWIAGKKYRARGQRREGGHHSLELGPEGVCARGVETSESENSDLRYGEKECHDCGGRRSAFPRDWKERSECAPDFAIDRLGNQHSKGHFSYLSGRAKCGTGAASVVRSAADQRRAGDDLGEVGIHQSRWIA